MIYRWVISGLVVCCLVLELHGMLQPSWAGDADTPWVSRVVSIQGHVLAKRHGEVDWRPVGLNDTLFVGDQIRVEANSRAGIVLSNDAVIRLDQNTTMVVTEIEPQSSIILNLLKGAAHFFSTWPRRLTIVTPFVNGVVEGTEFFVRVDDAQTQIDLFEGRIRTVNELGELQLAKGQGAVASANSAPQSRVLVHPRESVQWTLYYPPILAAGPDSGMDALRQSNVLYNQGQATEALDAMETVAESDRDYSFYTYRAALLLNVGRVDQAQEDIQHALSLQAANSEALALKAVIAVVQNRKSDALQAAQQAVKLNPQSAAAQIALSYARQAEFNLQAGLAAAQTAVMHNPGNGTAWARLAELRLSTGELDMGVQAAQKAASLNPHIAHAHTILGFAYLTQIKTKKAQAAFTQAIALDSAAPLPRLGLGLAKIRDGNLEEGRAEIEIAAGLDPGNALIRSYLGKAYFDEKRGPLDQRQFDIAKALDPNDPTPWFYDAIRKQTLNRPVEALQDLQKSIELNDNRAVYRSRLLLDEDLAARSASLGRIFNDLGFQRLGLVKGWHSVNTDPTNFSAHRLLSDSYATQPQHEIARVSELLQSQLLQPINITPIQPALAESNLFLIRDQGPSTPSFNTYSPLFNRNQASLLSTGQVGSNDSWGGEGIVSGIYDNLSLSAGYTHFETDGFRINNDQKDDIVNVFAQYELTYQTSIQGEYRYRDTQRGETQLRFLPDDFDPNLRQEDERNSLRIGFRHSPSPISVFLGNFGYQDANFSLNTKTDSDILTTNDTTSDQDSYSGEIGYLFRKEQLNIASGVGYFNINVEETITTTKFIPGFFLPIPGPPIFIEPNTETKTSVVDRDVQHTNLYLYSYLNFPKNVTLTLGVSGDLFDSGSQDETDTDQFNPKLGITWNPVSDTTLRGAVFRVLKRTLITDQTIEPTQVAGFNQFYDDANATDAWNYGIAVDQKFSNSIFGGVQFTLRDLKVPFSIEGDADVRELAEADWEEKLISSYLFWTPHEWVSLKGEWLWEHFERERFAFGAKEVETNYLPFGLNFFHSSGFTAGLKCTYVHQKGSFDRGIQAGIFEDGEDDFWLVDAFFGYRLPKRYGFITVGVTNLFDETFQYFDTNPENPRIQPDRSIFARLTLAFP